MDMRARRECFHCGQAIADAEVSQRVAGNEQVFCCEGCAAAARWIEQAELGDYYALRSAASARVAAEPGDFAAWDHASVLAEHAAMVPGGREICVLTDGMRCAACAWLIDRALRREDGVLDVIANAISGRIVLRWDPARVALSSLMSRLDTLGYRPWLGGGQARERERASERRRWLLRVGIAAFGAIQAMMFSEALYWDAHGTMAIATRDFFRWVTCLVATPVVLYSGWPFLAGMRRELRGRRIGMDTLVAGSILLAWAASVQQTVVGGPHVWFDAAAMFVLLLLLARMLEQRARALAGARVDAMARARPALVQRERCDGGLETVSSAALAFADVVRVAAGEAVPADGVLLDASAAFDESLLTGESTPARRAPGDPVLAGSVCGDVAIRLRVTGIGAETRLSQLVRLVERAQAQKPRLALLADRVAAAFAFVLIGCAALTWVCWQEYDPSRALEATLAVLVVSCPCALSLAIPAALTTAHGALARIGVLAVAPDALATLARVDHVVFDKTGTLAGNELWLESVAVFAGDSERRVLALAAALERGLTHPLARALAEFDDGTAVNDVQTVAGMGVQGRLGERCLRVGRGEFAAGRADDGAIWLGDGRAAIARFAFREQPRGDAAAAIDGLHRLGLQIDLCSGDAATPVQSLAKMLRIDTAVARQMPEDKLAHVQALQARGAVVAMVGDGINDAPVLAGADVSIAMGEGSALARAAADVVLTGTTLRRIPQAIALARRVRRIVRQNLGWALAYNLAAIPLAATGWIGPWQAALGMAASSLLVTVNALRLGARETRDG